MKRSKILVFLSALLIAACVPFASRAGVPSVKARLDSVQLLMGRISSLKLQVVQDKGRQGAFPIFSVVPQDGIVRVCGDSVELRTSFSRDTVDLGSGRIQINYDVPVQVFDSGTYVLPPFAYVSGRDTALSNQVTLKVIPVPVGADEQISDYAAIEEPNGSLFDFIPDWMADLWWLWLLIVALVVLFIIGYRRYKKQGTVLKKRPEPSPYEVAMRRLKNLKQRKLWEQGMEKEYFTLLTDILREYLEKRFGINALEMTSRQIIATLADNPEVKEKRDYMRQILDIADFVKFAKIRPLPEDNITAYDNAVRFIEETKPVPVDENDETLKKKGAKS